PGGKHGRACPYRSVTPGAWPQPRLPALARLAALAATHDGEPSAIWAHPRPIRAARQSVVVDGKGRRAPQPAKARRLCDDGSDDDLASPAGARTEGPRGAALSPHRFKGARAGRDARR